MSLDERLRAELDRAASGIVVDVERNLDAVEERARRRASVGPAPMLLAAAAIVVIAVGLRFGLVPSHGGPGASPTPAGPTASPYRCVTNLGSCLGPLGPGTYQTHTFAPQINYTVPDGWANTLDTRGEMDLRYGAGGTTTYPDGTVFHDGISIFRRPLAESAASFVFEPGIGIKALDLATWLNGHVDLVATGLAPVTIGGATGYRLEIALPTGARTSPDHCTTDHGDPRCESLFLPDDPSNAYGFGIVGPETAVIYLLDAPTGDTVMIVIDDVDGVDRAGLIAAATPIVNSITFVGFESPATSP